MKILPRPSESSRVATAGSSELAFSDPGASDDGFVTLVSLTAARLKCNLLRWGNGLAFSPMGFLSKPRESGSLHGGARFLLQVKGLAALLKRSKGTNRIGGDPTVPRGK